MVKKKAKGKGKARKSRVASGSRRVRVFDVSRDSLEYEYDYNPEETRALRKRLQRKQHPTIDDLRRVALWKIDRVLNVPESLLADLGALARRRKINRRDGKTGELIEALVRCDGIHYPMASAILKFLRPDVFPIIDVRAYRALTGRKLSRKTYSLQRYLDYADELERLAVRLERPLSEIDEQLYKFDQEKNDRI